MSNPKCDGNKIIILQGISGAGKTTWANKYMTKFNGTHLVCSADDYFMKPIPGVGLRYDFKIEELSKAHGACFRKAINGCIQRSDYIYIDNTNTVPEEVAPYILLAQAFEYTPEIVYIQALPLDCGGRSVHKVGIEEVMAQYQRLIEFKGQYHWPERQFIEANSF